MNHIIFPHRKSAGRKNVCTISPPWTTPSALSLTQRWTSHLDISGAVETGMDKSDIKTYKIPIYREDDRTSWLSDISTTVDINSEQGGRQEEGSRWQKAGGRSQEAGGRRLYPRVQWALSWLPPLTAHLQWGGGAEAGHLHSQRGHLHTPLSQESGLLAGKVLGISTCPVIHPVLVVILILWTFFFM